VRLIQPFVVPGDGGATLTVAEANFVESAALVAVTVIVPVEFGAVNTPDVEIVPAVVVQLTPVFVVPATVAVKA